MNSVILERQAPLNRGAIGVSYSKVIMALDPGGTTGVAIANLDNDKIMLNGYQIGPHEHHNGLYQKLGDEEPNVVVSESFSFRQHKKTGSGSKDKVELISREYIGVAKLYCRQFGVTYHEQEPSHAFHFVTDWKLDKLGLLEKKVADRHYHDSMRHLIYYMVVSLGIKKPFTDVWKG